MKIITKVYLSTIILVVLSSSLFADDVNTTRFLQEQQNLYFIENKGQIVDQHNNRRRDIEFKLETPDINIFVGNGQIHYQWSRVERKTVSENPAKGIFDPLVFEQEQMQDSIEVNMCRMDVTLVGADMNAELVAEEQQLYYENYYLPQCPDGISAHSYKKITYKNVYSNIDWVLYIANNSLKYDFVVRKGGNANDIKLRYEGATSLVVSDGIFTATTPYGTISEQKPYTYDALTREEIASSFVLNGNELGFDVSVSDNDIVIDPMLRWATYYGGYSDEKSIDIAADTSGNVFLCGLTGSSSYIATTGAYQTTNMGNGDAFLTKFDIDGKLVWATYYGDNQANYATGITIDINSDIYIAGTWGPSATAGSSFLAKFNQSGSKIWHRAVGKWDQGYGTTSDDSGNVYLFGKTLTDTGIATQGTYIDTLLPNILNGFLIKYDSSGKKIWGTYVPGEVFDAKVDANEDVYLVGRTTSTTHIATPGAYKSSYTGASLPYYPLEGYFVKVNGSCQRLWGTYLGTKIFNSIETASSGNVYAAGHFSPLAPYLWRADICKFKKNGELLFDYGNVLGMGLHETFITSLVIAPDESIFCFGQTKDFNFVVSGDGYKKINTGVNENFMGKFSPDGYQKYGTYYGGEGKHGNALLTGPPKTPIDPLINLGGITYAKNKIYFSSYTTSISNIATSGAYQTTITGYYSMGPEVIDAYLVQFEDDTSAYFIQPFIDTGFCVGDTFKLPYRTIHSFSPGNIFTVQLSDSGGKFTNPINIGNITQTDGDTIVCVIPSVPTGVKYRIRILGSLPATYSYTNGIDISIGNVKPLKPTATSNSPVCIGAALQFNAITSDTTVTWKWDGPGMFTSDDQSPIINHIKLSDTGIYVVKAVLFGCESEGDTVMVKIDTPSTVNVIAYPDTTICNGDTLMLITKSSNYGVNPQFEWFKNGASTGITTDTFRTSTAANNDTFYIKMIAGTSCKSPVLSDSVMIGVLPVLKPVITISASPGTFIGPYNKITFSSSNSNLGFSPEYQWIKNGVNIPGATNGTYIGITKLDFRTDDTICLRAVSSLKCANPDTVFSNCVVVTIDLGINAINKSHNFTLYPNPNNGNFTLRTNMQLNEKPTVEISNILGQVIHKESLQVPNGRLLHQIELPDLPEGIYNVKITTSVGEENLPFTVIR